jgi:hypothetical protein
MRLYGLKTKVNASVMGKNSAKLKCSHQSRIDFLKVILVKIVAKTVPNQGVFL